MNSLSTLARPTESVVAGSPPAPKRKKSQKPRLLRVVGYVMLAAFAVALLMPFFWMVSSSLKSPNDVFSFPIQWLPEVPMWHHYVEIWA